MQETVNEYVSRLRLERAANLLVVYRRRSVSDIALQCGFSSSANFARDFKSHFGVTPSEMRKPHNIKNSKIGKLTRKYGKEFNPSEMYPQFSNQHQFEEWMMNIEVREYEECTTCYLTSPRGYESKALFDTWDKLITWARNNGIDDQQQQRIAICYDNPAVTPLEKCRYDASVVIPAETKLVAPFARSSIPAGRYAVAHFKGDPQETTKFHQAIYTQWLPTSGFEPDHFPLMEHYLNDSRKDGYVEMEVCIKIRDCDGV